MKWVDYDAMATIPVVDPVLAARLRQVSARFFLALDGASFGRCDLRVDRNGTPFMLEINPNCGVFYPPSDPGSADICLALDPAGHEGFTRQLIAAAFRRHESRPRERDLPRHYHGEFAQPVAHRSPADRVELRQPWLIHDHEPGPGEPG
jgi:D-alanine-D-alanine ligase